MRGGVRLSAPLGRITPRQGRLTGLGSLMAGGILNKILGAFRLLIFAPLLGPAGFGALRLAATVSTILSALAGLGFYTSYVRYLPEASTEGERSFFMRRSLLLSLVPAALIAMALLTLPTIGSRLIFSQSGYNSLVLLVAISLPITVIYKSFIGAANGLGRFRVSALAEGVQNLAYMAGGVALMLLAGRIPEYAFTAFLAGMFAATLLLWPVMPLKRSAPADRIAASRLLRRALSYSLWFALIPMFQYLFDFIDRWMLARFRNLETSGTYSIVPILAGGMFVIGAAFTPVVARKGSELTAAGAHPGAERLVWSSVLLCIFGSLVYALGLRTMEPLLWRMFRPEWASAAIVIPPFLLYFTLYNVYTIVGCVAAFAEKPWVHMTALILGASTNTILNYAWIPRWGMKGAAAGTLLGLIVSLMVHIGFIKWRGIRIPRRIGTALALSLIVFLPRILFLPAAVLVLWVLWRTSLVLCDSDRRLARVTITRALRRTGLKGAAS